MNHDASMTTSIISDKSKSALHLCFYHIYSSIVDLILDKQKKKKRHLSLNMLEYTILLHQYLHILYSLCCDSMRLTRNIPASFLLLAYCVVSASCWSCRICKAFSGTGGSCSQCWHCLAPVTPSWTYCTTQSDSEFCFTTLPPMY